MPILFLLFIEPLNADAIVANQQTPVMTINHFRDYNRSLPLALLTVLVLVFSQGVALQHSHDGDLNYRYDCDFCVKLGTSDNLLSSDAPLPEPADIASIVLPSSDQPIFSLAPTPLSRAPPQA